MPWEFKLIYRELPWPAESGGRTHPTGLPTISGLPEATDKQCRKIIKKEN
jgi:hypothetical protein